MYKFVYVYYINLIIYDTLTHFYNFQIVKENVKDIKLLMRYFDLKVKDLWID